MKPYLTSTLLALTLASAALAHGNEKHGTAKKEAPPATTPAPAPASKGHAPGDHEHPSPHGGDVVTVDKEVHAEVLFSDVSVSVWFYDGEMKPLAPPADGKLTLVVGKETKKLALTVGADPAEQDHVGVEAALPKEGKVVALVQATVAGKPRTARVERSHKHDAKGHAHVETATSAKP